MNDDDLKMFLGITLLFVFLGLFSISSQIDKLNDKIMDYKDKVNNIHCVTDNVEASEEGYPINMTGADDYASSPEGVNAFKYDTSKGFGGLNLVENETTIIMGDAR